MPNEPRRTHQKSRTGCETCKRRRVKCDESKPKCKHCTRRQLSCSYETKFVGSSEGLDTRTPESLPSRQSQFSKVESDEVSNKQLQSPATDNSNSPLSNTNVPGLPPFDAFDLELLHHFTINVARSFAEQPFHVDFWSNEIPSMAFSHAFILHAALALSALHLAHEEPSRKTACLAKSDFHHSICLPQMIQALSHVDNTDTSALWVASMLLCFHSLARGPSPGEYLAFSDKGELEWLWLLHGIRSITTELGFNPFNAFRVSPFEMDAAFIEGAQNNSKSPLAFQEPLQRLRIFLDGVAAEDPSAMKYGVTMDNLEDSFSRALQPADTDGQEFRVISHLIFKFLFQLEEQFLQALQAKRPLALIIYAHYMALFAQLHDKWYLEGWVRHIMNGIYANLHVQYRHWLQWPVEIIEQKETLGWTPD